MQVPAILTTSPFFNAHISNSHHKAISFMHVPTILPPQAHFFNAHISQRRCLIMAPKTVDDVPRKCDESSSFLHLHKWIGLLPHSSSIGSNMQSSTLTLSQHDNAKKTNRKWSKIMKRNGNKKNIVAIPDRSLS